MGAVTVAFSNTSPNTTYRLNIKPESLGRTRTEYVLQGHHDHHSGSTTTDNRLETSILELNGSILRGGNATQLPKLKGRAQVNHRKNPLMLPPVSLGFVVFEMAKAPACDVSLQLHTQMKNGKPQRSKTSSRTSKRLNTS